MRRFFVGRSHTAAAASHLPSPTHTPTLTIFSLRTGAVARKAAAPQRRRGAPARRRGGHARGHRSQHA